MIYTTILICYFYYHLYILKLQIDVTDRGTPPLKVSVTLDITLTPVNEFDPQFMSMPPSLVLNEDTPVGTMIHDTKPYDQDLNEQREGQKTKVTLSCKQPKF